MRDEINETLAGRLYEKRQRSEMGRPIGEALDYSLKNIRIHLKGRGKLTEVEFCLSLRLDQTRFEASQAD
jgi:hypothetical protein